jgi:hypothetical protein
MIKMCIHCTCVVVSVFFNQLLGAVVVVIVWYFDLQLPVQSVPITSNVVGSNRWLVLFCFGFMMFNATFNNVSYSIEHRDQFFWCLTTLSTMCQV